MEYILTQEEYDDLKAETNEEVQEWIKRANSLFTMLKVAKNYPCHNFGYCDMCELENSDICFRPRQYGK